jgi:hypothetical protein
MFSACPHLRTNFIEEFLVGRELKFLSHKVQARLVQNSHLVHSQMTKKTKKAHSYLIYSLCLVHNLSSDNYEFSIRGHFHNNSFSSKLTIGPNKIDLHYKG